MTKYVGYSEDLIENAVYRHFKGGYYLVGRIVRQGKFYQIGPL